MNNAQFYETLKNRQPQLIEAGRPAAVLLAFVPENGGWSLVLEERSHGLHHQPGEICLPGGKAEPGETPEQTAVRETCEELLLSPNQVELWGPGDLMVTQGRQTVCTWFGRLKGYQGTFCADEVHTVFTVPADWLLTHPPVKYDTAVQTCPGGDFPYNKIPGGRDYRWPKGRWSVYFYEYGDRVIWGLTAKMIFHGLEVLKQLGGLPPLP